MRLGTTSPSSRVLRICLGVTPPHIRLCCENASKIPEWSRVFHSSNQYWVHRIVPGILLLLSVLGRVPLIRGVWNREVTPPCHMTYPGAAGTPCTQHPTYPGVLVLRGHDTPKYPAGMSDVPGCFTLQVVAPGTYPNLTNLEILGTSPLHSKFSTVPSRQSRINASSLCYS